MIAGIGIDVVEVRTTRRWLTHYSCDVLNLVFTKKELEVSFCRSDAAQFLATCFAGKEAVVKALAFDLEPIDWSEIEIAPRLPCCEIRLYGKAQQHCAARGISRCVASCTDILDHVIVVAIAETQG